MRSRCARDVYVCLDHAVGGRQPEELWQAIFPIEHKSIIIRTGAQAPSWVGGVGEK